MASKVSSRKAWQRRSELVGLEARRWSASPGFRQLQRIGPVEAHDGQIQLRGRVLRLKPRDGFKKCVSASSGRPVVAATMPAML